MQIAGGRPVWGHHEGTTATKTHEGKEKGEYLVIVEVKSVEVLEPIHDAQLLTYLRLSQRWLGLLVNC